MPTTAADTRLQRVRELSARKLSDHQAQAIARVLRWWPARMDHSNGNGKCYPFDEIRKHLPNTKAAIETGFFKATGWSHADHRQRAWTLTAAGEAAHSAILNAPQQPTPPPKNKGGRPRTRAVNRYGKRGNRAGDVQQISTAPELNTEHAQNTLDYADVSATTRAQLQAALEGDISYTYRQTNTGRLQGQGRHLQGFTKQAKAALLPDCYDIDIANCHPTIIQQLARQHGIDDTPTLDDYLNNKKQWRTRLANHCNAPVKDIKACLISLIYGAQITGTIDTAIVKTLGKNKAKRFISHPDITELHTELSYLTRVIVRKARKHSNRIGNIHNAQGLPIHRSAKANEIISHIAQGIESKAMQCVAEQLPCIVECWMHDGVIVRQELSASELQAIAANVKKITGFDICLDIEPLNAGWQAKEQCSKGATAQVSADLPALPFQPMYLKELEESKAAPQTKAQPPLTDAQCDNSLFRVTLSMQSYGSVHTQNCSVFDGESEGTPRTTGPPHRAPP